jgi:hypothetical protein
MIENGKIVRDWSPEFIGRLYRRPVRMVPVGYDMELLQAALLRFKEPLLKRLYYFFWGK